jgi:hypothetical protein
LIVLLSAATSAAFGATQWTCRSGRNTMKVTLDRQTRLMKLERDGSTADGYYLHVTYAGVPGEGYSLNSGDSVFWVQPATEQNAKFQPCIGCIEFLCQPEN